ncbi:MAG: succinate dehydrogenase, cytochrome b556 subunit [Acidiferrobacteraceae bacterium]
MRSVKTSWRPVDQGLLHSRLPVGAVVSILHRATGVLLAIVFPGLLYALSRSLHDERSFDAWRQMLESHGGRVLLAVVAWLLAHHLLAGIRHILLDLDVGAGLRAARASAYAILMLATVAALVVAVLL